MGKKKGIFRRATALSLAFAMALALLPATVNADENSHTHDWRVHRAESNHPYKDSTLASWLEYSCYSCDETDQNKYAGDYGLQFDGNKVTILNTLKEDEFEVDEASTQIIYQKMNEKFNYVSWQPEGENTQPTEPGKYQAIIEAVNVKGKDGRLVTNMMGEVSLLYEIPEQHVLTYTQPSSTKLVVTCANNGTYCNSTGELSLELTVSKVEGASYYTASLVKHNGIENYFNEEEKAVVENCTISYDGGDSTVPTSAGRHTASVTLALGGETYTLETNYLNDTTGEGTVAVSGGEEYSDLQKAINSASNGAEILLVQNVTNLTSALQIPAGRNAVLNLRGNTIENNNGEAIVVSRDATLTIKDDSQTAGIIRSAEGSVTIDTNGALIVENGQIYAGANYGTISVSDTTDHAASFRLTGGTLGSVVYAAAANESSAYIDTAPIQIAGGRFQNANPLVSTNHRNAAFSLTGGIFDADKVTRYDIIPYVAEPYTIAESGRYRTYSVVRQEKSADMLYSAAGGSNVSADKFDIQVGDWGFAGEETFADAIKVAEADVRHGNQITLLKDIPDTSILYQAFYQNKNIKINTNGHVWLHQSEVVAQPVNLTQTEVKFDTKSDGTSYTEEEQKTIVNNLNQALTTASATTKISSDLSKAATYSRMTEDEQNKLQEQANKLFHTTDDVSVVEQLFYDVAITNYSESGYTVEITPTSQMVATTGTKDELGTTPLTSDTDTAKIISGSTKTITELNTPVPITISVPVVEGVKGIDVSNADNIEVKHAHQVSADVTEYYFYEATSQQSQSGYYNVTFTNTTGKFSSFTITSKSSASASFDGQTVTFSGSNQSAALPQKDSNNQTVSGWKFTGLSKYGIDGSTLYRALDSKLYGALVQAGVENVSYAIAASYPASPAKDPDTQKPAVKNPTTKNTGTGSAAVAESTDNVVAAVVTDATATSKSRKDKSKTTAAQTADEEPVREVLGQTIEPADTEEAEIEEADAAVVSEVAAPSALGTDEQADGGALLEADQSDVFGWLWFGGILVIAAAAIVGVLYTKQKKH